MDRERSQLPEAQIVIERENQANKRMPELNALNTLIRDTEAKLWNYRQQYSQLNTEIMRVRRGLNENETDEEKQKKVFILPCPVSECRGFLSTAYKCGVCEI